MYVFFSVFEKVKKYVFACNFLKTRPMELKTCAKKSCNRSGSSPKILSKSVVFSKIYDIFRLVHFFFDLTVRFKPWDPTKPPRYLEEDVAFVFTMRSHSETITFQAAVRCCVTATLASETF